MKKVKPLPIIYLILLTVIMYLPIVIEVIYSFNENKISSIWTGFSFKWYKTLFQDEAMFEALRNSLILAFSSSVLAAIFGTFGAIGMQKVRIKGKGFLEYISTLPIMIPEIILAFVLLAFFSLMAFPLGMLTLIIAHTTFCIPYIYMQVKARLVGLDPSLPEAARDLGATEWQTLRDVTLPQLVPGILSGMILSFAMSFDDVIISMFVTGPTVNTLPIKIYTQIKTGVTPEINALCTILLIVTIVIFVVSTLIGNRNRKIEIAT